VSEGVRAQFVYDLDKRHIKRNKAKYKTTAVALQDNNNIIKIYI
jgi:hypothetical protein